MKQLHIGLFLLISSFIAWILTISMLFDYTVHMLQPDHSFGEPIWVINPLRFWIISIPAGFVFLVGLLAIVGDLLPKEQ